MNKTNFNTNGGFGELLDDLTFEQESIRDAFKGVLSGFGISAGADFVISGCDLYGTFLNYYHEGYIFFKGEICKVDAAAKPTIAGGESAVWVLDLSYDASGDKVLENTNAFHAYHIRKVKMISAVYNASIHMYAGVTQDTLASNLVEIVAADNSSSSLAARILYVIANSGLYDSSTLSWVTFTPTLSANDGSNIVAGGFTGTATGRYRYKNNTLHIKMKVTAVAVLSTVKFLGFSLPVSIASPFNAEGFNLCKYYNGSAYSSKQIKIELRHTGQGTGLEVSNFDASDIGAHSNGEIEYSITIGFRKDGE